jgi:hypothetical protein
VGQVTPKVPKTNQKKEKHSKSAISNAKEKLEKN